MLIAECGQLGFRCGQLARVLLHQRFLPGYVAQAVDVLAEALLIAGEIALVGLRGLHLRLIRGNLALLGDDAIKLGAARGAQRTILRHAHQEVRRCVADAGGLIVDALFADYECLNCFATDGDFEALRGGGQFLRLHVAQQRVATA